MNQLVHIQPDFRSWRAFVAILMSAPVGYRCCYVCNDEKYFVYHKLDEDRYSLTTLSILFTGYRGLEITKVWIDETTSETPA